MELIITPENAGFDAVASLVAAKKFYKEASLCILGLPERRVRAYLQGKGGWINYLREKEVKLEDISRLVIVDTRATHKIGKFRRILKKVEVHVYDHHPPAEDDIEAKGGLIKGTGATATLFVGMMQEEKIELTSHEATLFATGICEDTGFLTFPSTTDEDKEALEYLRGQGANMDEVRSFLSGQLSRAQLLIFQELLHTSQIHYFGDARVAIAHAVSNEYVPDIAVLAHKMHDMQNLSAVIIIVRICEHTLIILRSKTPLIDAGFIARKLGGGGHTSAGSAYIKGGEPEKLREQVLGLLREHIGKVAAPAEITPIEFARDISSTIREEMPEDVVKILQEAGSLGDEMGMGVYCVGGFVRDLLLGVGNYDVDLVVEGDGIGFAKRLAERLGGRARAYGRFGTAVVGLRGGRRVDVATARQEFYEYPGALPQVRRGTIRADLARRDFTINAMAVCLNEGNFGKLLDLFKGEKDLKHGVIRALHRLSFVEDATRLFRAVRFEVRFSFRIEEETASLMHEARELELTQTLTPSRIWNEMVLIMREEKAGEMLIRLSDFLPFSFLHSDVVLDEEKKEFIRRISSLIKLFKEKGWDDGNAWFAYVLALLDGLEREARAEFCQRFTISRRRKNAILRSITIPKKIHRILTEEGARNSEIFNSLSPLDTGEIIFYMAKSKDPERALKQVELFMNILKKVEVQLTGNDLRNMGFKNGRIIGKILDELRAARLDGLVKGRDDEVRYVIEKWRRKNE